MYHPADTNGDGQVDNYERQMYLEFKRKELEDADAQRDAMRKMTWFALFGMLLYPITIMITSFLNLENAAKIIGDIAPTYFVAISALVSVFLVLMLIVVLRKKVLLLCLRRHRDQWQRLQWQRLPQNQWLHLHP